MKKIIDTQGKDGLDGYVKGTKDDTWGISKDIDTGA